MSARNDGGPAFPFAFEALNPEEPGLHGGMTLRDYFAARAMQGLMGRSWVDHKGSDEDLIAIWAKSAYGVADAMLKARASTKEAG